MRSLVGKLLRPRRNLIIGVICPRRSSPGLEGAVIAERHEVGIRRFDLLVFRADSDRVPGLFQSERMMGEVGAIYLVEGGVEVGVGFVRGHPRRRGKGVVGNDTHAAVGESTLRPV
jgi:hypothetical protein